MSDSIPVKSPAVPKYILYPAWVVLGVFGVMMLITEPLLFLFIIALTIVWPTLTPTVIYVDPSAEKPKDNDASIN